MGALDAAQDNEISYQEFVTAALDKTEMLSETKMRNAFNKCDIDGDGHITLQELDKVFAGVSDSYNDFKQFWDQILSEADTNKNGMLEYSEFKAALQ